MVQDKKKKVQPFCFNQLDLLLLILIVIMICFWVKTAWHVAKESINVVSIVSSNFIQKGLQSKINGQNQAFQPLFRKAQAS